MIYLEQMQEYPVTIGELTLHLNGYRITGGCLVREQGTSDGTAAVTVLAPKGTRITLQGKLAPPEGCYAGAAAALDSLLREGGTMALSLGTLRCAGARLIGYTLDNTQLPPEVTLVFYTQTPMEEENG